MTETTTEGGVPYGEAAPGSCCWITDDSKRFNARVCGEPVARQGCSWCPAHRARVYVQRSRRPQHFARLKFEPWSSGQVEAVAA